MEEELPQGLATSLEVVERSPGDVGRRDWLLRDSNTGKLYRVSPATVAHWDVPFRAESIGPSIILALLDRNMVSLHLPTGEVYQTGRPPSRLR